MEVRMKSKVITVLMLTLMMGVFSPYTMAVEIGDMAPDFTAQSTAGKISLSDFRGEKNVVLALYYFINTPV